MRSRIVRPTLAKVGARLPPVSDCTEKRRGKQEKGLQRNALRQSMIGGPRIVAETDAAHDFFQLGTQRAARFVHGVLQGIGDAGPRPQRGHHQVDGIGQLGLDPCRLPRRQIGLQSPRQQADDQCDRDHEGRGPAEGEVQEPGRQEDRAPGREAVAARDRNGPREPAPAGDASEASAACSIRSRASVAGPRVPPVGGDHAQPQQQSGQY